MDDIPPLVPFSGSVTATNMVKSASSTLLIQIFLPLITQSVPSLTALVTIDDGSEPAPGSDIAIAETVSPFA